MVKNNDLKSKWGIDKNLMKFNKILVLMLCFIACLGLVNGEELDYTHYDVTAWDNNLIPYSVKSQIHDGLTGYTQCYWSNSLSSTSYRTWTLYFVLSETKYVEFISAHVGYSTSVNWYTPRNMLSYYSSDGSSWTLSTNQNIPGVGDTWYNLSVNTDARYLKLVLTDPYDPVSMAISEVKIYGVGVSPALDISNPQPTNNSELAFGTTSTTLGISTNINADCRYSTNLGMDFSQMTLFSTTGGISHSSIITGLQNGQSYDYYIKCNDTATGNITDDSRIYFSVSDTEKVIIIFNYTGSDQTWIVPTEVTSINVKMWGAGGASGYWPGSNGGGGGFTIANVTVTPGEDLVLLVGGGGQKGVSYAYPGSGGGRSAIRRNTLELLTAGGGGGGAHYGPSGNGAYGGAGGGTIGGNGGNEYPSDYTTGGTQSAGGIGLYANGAQFQGADAGSINLGGYPNGGNAGINIGGGGGGDGYFGGGAGNTDVGGGGGSGYVGLTGGTTTAGDSNNSAGTSDQDYIVGIGIGGFSTSSSEANDGGNGLIVISYIAAPSGCIDNDNDGYGAAGSNHSLCNYTQEDCNDNNLNIYPGATEVKNNGIDENCDGVDATSVYILVPDFLETSEMNTYYVGDEIKYSVTLTEDGTYYDSTTIIVNLTDETGTVFDSHTLLDMTKISTGIYEGVFYSGSYSARPDSLGQGIRLEAWAYDNGNFLDLGVHFDQNFPDGTAPSLSSATYTVTTTAISNYTVKDLVVNSTEAKIDWTGTSLDLNARAINFDTAATFADKFVKVNTVAYNELNNSAALTFDNVDCSSPYVFYSATANDRETLLSENNQCLPPQCTNIQCTGSTLTVDVLSFSGYAAEADANLSIDADDPKFAGAEVHFTADYRNVTDNSFISGAACTIYFTDGNYPMDEGAIYTYNRTFVTEGVKEYNVTCSKTGFSTLTAFDNATITSAEIPEFSMITLGLGLLIVLIGLFVIRKKR